MDVGFVGVGNMGRHMSGHMLAAGHKLTVYDVSEDALASLESQGATRAADLPSVSRAASVIFLSLPNETAVKAVVIGDDTHPGLLAGTQPGHVIIDLSTVSPDSTRTIAEHASKTGVRFIDAPVSGSVSGAVSGTLAVMVGASEESVATYKPLFDAIGENIFYLGEVGKGNTLKLLNNLVALSSQAVLCEAMALADRVGVDRETVANVISRSSGASFILDHKRSAFIDHDYKAGFFVELARKDLRLAIALARDAGARLELVETAERLYDEAMDSGHARLDSCGVIRVLEP